MIDLSDDDVAYVRIVDTIDWQQPVSHLTVHLEELRKLASNGHIESMVLLAVFLGDIDSELHRSEIIRLNEKAFELGSPTAAGNMAIQYAQWNEPFLSKLWHSRETP